MHLINFKNMSGQQIQNMVNTALDIKLHDEKHLNALSGKVLAMIFQKPSTRTRVSFEVAMGQLGGQALFIDWRTTKS